MFGHRKNTEGSLIYADPTAAEKPVTPRRRGLQALAVGLVALALVLAAVAALGFTVQGLGQRYQAALSLLDQQEYEAAAAELAELGTFRDSAQLVRWGVTQRQAEDLMARAQQAQTRLSARMVPAELDTILRDWEAAAALWEELKDTPEVPDAAARAEECWTAAAELALRHGDPEKALDYLDRLSDEGAQAIYESYLSVTGGA